MWKHLGSTIALVLGVVALLAGFASAYRRRGTGAGDLIVSAPIIILSALAYRSAKKRMLGQVAAAAIRRAEAFAILLILILVFAHDNLKALMVAQPVHYVVIPVWAIAAYLCVGFRRPRNSVDAKVFD